MKLVNLHVPHPCQITTIFIKSDRTPAVSAGFGFRQLAAAKIHIQHGGGLIQNFEVGTFDCDALGFIYT